MIKRKKKVLFTFGLTALLLASGVSSFVFASRTDGTDRAFSKISIIPKQRYSYLVNHQTKETANDYSYVKIDTFKTCTSVDIRLSSVGMSTNFEYVDDYTITEDDAGTWLQLSYTTNEPINKGMGIVLGARNSSYSKKSAGYIAGYVNYQ